LQDETRGAVVELLIVAVIGGVALAIVLAAGIWNIVSRAVDNGLDWLIHTFSNDQAAKRVEQKWRSRE
jgi:cobalamin biosynthesis protein CbiD